MNEREELEALRRLAALEAKAKTAEAPAKPDAASGSYNLRFGPFDTGIKVHENVGNFLAGAGQNMTDLAMGAGQWAGLVSRDDVKERRALDADLNQRTAAKLGNLSSNLLLALAPGANTLGGAARIGALTGAMRSSESTGETLGNIALESGGAAAGQWAGNKLGQIIAGRVRPQPNASQTASQTVNVGPGAASATANVTATPTVRGAGGSTFGAVGDDPVAGLTRAQRGALEDGRALGMRVTPGQASGSRVLQQFEAKLESQPVSSGRFFAIKDNNQRQINRLVARELGMESDNLAPEVLDAAYANIQRTFDSVADRVPRPIEADGFLDRLARVEGEAEGMLPAPLLNNPLVDRYYRLIASGNATGEQLNNLQSQVGKAVQALRRNDPATAQALRGVQNMILDDLGTGLTPEAQAAYRAARQRYRMFATITDKPQMLNPGTGNVSALNLANHMQRTDRTGFTTGRRDSDLYAGLRFAQAFKPLVGDSGTATRSPLNTLEFLASVPVSVGTSAYTSSPSIAVTTALANALERGAVPQSLSMAQRNGLMRALGAAGGAGGAASEPYLLGN